MKKTEILIPIPKKYEKLVKTLKDKLGDDQLKNLLVLN